MKRHDTKTMELLAAVVERFLFHKEIAEQDRPYISQIAREMTEIEMAEMWVCTQM